MELWIIYDQKYEGQDYALGMLKSALNNKIKAKLFYWQYFEYLIKGNDVQLYYKGKKVNKLPIFAMLRGYDEDIRRYLEEKGVKFVNKLNGTILTRDKYKMHQYISNTKLSQPLTIYSRNISYETVVKQLGTPFIMKDRFGQKGNNVYLVDNKTQFKKIVEQNPTVLFVYQQYIKKSCGKDIRICIAGDKVAGVIERMSQNGDFRSNTSQGGKVRLYNDVPDEILKQSLKISQKLGLHFCSMDYLLDGNKYIFCEANSNIGFGGFLQNGIDVRDMVMKYIKRNL